MRKKIAAILAPIALAASGLASAPAFAASDAWTPVPMLQAVETGPQPGTACTRNGERRQFVTLTGSHFDVEGQVSTSNDTDGVVPIQQTIKESKSRKWTWSATVNVKLTDEIYRKYHWEYNREIFWSMGQKVGPYDLNPGETGTLAWGFIIDDYTSQPVICSTGTWKARGALRFGSAPRERHVEIAIN